jgi:hypothetical protein
LDGLPSASVTRSESSAARAGRLNEGGDGSNAKVFTLLITEMIIAAANRIFKKLRPITHNPLLVIFGGRRKSCQIDTVVPRRVIRPNAEQRLSATEAIHRHRVA